MAVKLYNMLTLNYTPYFDITELITELTIPFKKRTALIPLTAGSLTPNFTLQKEHGKWQRFFNGKQIRNTFYLHDILTKPLVISFYSKEWNGYGLEVLKNLNNLQKEIVASGGNLLIISSEKESTEKTAWDNNLSLSFYFDQKHSIAERFRIYSEKDPLWDRFSGIDSNVPMLATYVISPKGQIIYDHIEEDFSEPFEAKDILTALQQSR
jgi:peroxiredoxin